MVYFVPEKEKRTFEEIVKEIGTEVADMGIIVDGGATRIEAHVSFFKGLEGFFGTRKGIIEDEFSLLLFHSSLWLFPSLRVSLSFK
jgi:hypothetical protein